MTGSTINLVAFLQKQIAEMSVPASSESYLVSPLFQLILRGEAKLPLDRVEQVARAMGVDIQLLFRLAMRQFYDEESVSLFERMLRTPVTHEEQQWLDAIRSAADGPVAEPSGMARRLLRALANPSASE
ncbi:hypothetical protein ABK249_01485 [Neorhizobium sp. Rsf11]|uniref:Uncharacterized protein n=1 Tax=Neorhizobium phenanthreniclasticum TaxID=3157917 RepID=A0ABV0LVG6_9HYPH